MVYFNKIAALCCVALHLLLLQATAQQTADTSLPALSPRPAMVAGISKPVLSLNGTWQFSTDWQPAIHPVQVPGEWEMQGFSVAEGETAQYRRHFVLPADWQGQVVKLRFDGVSTHAVVKVNGKTVAAHEGGFVPFEADITGALHGADNLLEVEVQARTISDWLACTSQYAVHTVGGLLRNVTVFAVPRTHITDITINTVLDKDLRQATLQLQASTSEAMPAGNLQYTLQDNEGRKVWQFKANAGQQASKAVPHARLWDAEHPYLYTLTTSLVVDGQLQESVQQKVGLRQVTIQDGILLVNGHPVKLHGVNRHSVYPLTGRSIPDSLDVLDAVLLRQANCNYVRTSHYPPSEAFLNACDSLGIFVESESALCWIQHGASPIWQLWNFRDERFLPYMMKANIEKVVAQKNHPSIIIWSLGNESRWSELWDQVNQRVKRLDPTRPTTFHDQCWGGYNNAHSTADIAVYHYPGLNGPHATDTMQRPVLFGEYAHISTYNRRELLTDPGIRSAYGPSLQVMYDSMFHYSRCLGGAIWSGIDDIFHMPDGRIVGYGPWGIMDAWRRPKPEYFGVKKAYSPIRILHASWPEKEGDPLVLRIENRYDFTNLREVKITATTAAGTNILQAVIASHATGEIRVPVKPGTTDLQITFTDPRGFVAEAAIYQKPAAPPVEPPRAITNTFTENDGAIRIQQGAATFTISKHTGMIIRAAVGERTVMEQGPVFCVIPMNTEDGGKPNVAGETYQNNIYPLKQYPLYTLFASEIKCEAVNGQVSVGMQVRFSDGSYGKLRYLFKGDSLRAGYTITYKGNDTLPYQYGMLMQLPRNMDQLNWVRIGEFSGYPGDDIGRTNGKAALLAQPTTEVEPWGQVPQHAWKDDANALGSNDFRATRRQVMEVSLQNATGQKITAYGGGKQASRCWLQDQQIQWLIADYSNNGSEPFYGTPFTKGETNIKGKTLSGEVVIRVH